MSPCVTRKAGGGRTVFTVPPQPPLPGQCFLQQQVNISAPSEPQGSPIPPVGPAVPVAHPLGNVGGPHGPNLGVNPHRQTTSSDLAPAEAPQSGAHSNLTSGSVSRSGHPAASESVHPGGSHPQQGAFNPHLSPHGLKPMACPQHLDLVTVVPHAPACLDPGLHSFWCSLSLQQRRQLLRLPKKDLFARVRSLYCSGCFSLVQLQYDELCAYVASQMAAGRNGGCSGPPQCAICAAGHACFAGLSVSEDGAVTLTDDLLAAHPFGRFDQARTWDQSREQHFSCGEVCGSGWCKRPGVNKCKLHTGPVSPDDLLSYWSTLPEPRREALMTLDEETFLGELDVSMKLQLRICKECRSNVTRAFKELKPGRDAVGQANAATGLVLCEGHELRAGEGRVRVEGPGEACLFEKAEEVQEQKAFDAAAGDQDSPETIRHAETPELAREALQDSALLIFKAQVEVAFRDQTACRNALLLFTVLCHGLLEQQLANAYKELGAKRAEAELLRLLEEDAAKETARREKKASKAAKAKKQQPVAPAGVSTACAQSEQLQTSDSDEVEAESDIRPTPAATSVASAAKDLASSIAACGGSAINARAAAAAEKGRDGATASAFSAGTGKHAAGAKQQQGQQGMVGKHSRAASLEEGLPEAMMGNASSLAMSRSGKQQQATHVQQNGSLHPVSGKAAGRAVALPAAASGGKAKENDVAVTAKDKSHKAKEPSPVPVAIVALAKGGKGTIIAGAQIAKGAKAAGDAAPAVGQKSVSSAVGQSVTARTAPAPPALRQLPAVGLRQVQHMPPPPPPPPPPRQQPHAPIGQGGAGSNALVSASAAAVAIQPPAPQLNSSNFPPLRSASSATPPVVPTPQRAASPQPQTQPPMQQQQPAHGTPATQPQPTVAPVAPQPAVAGLALQPAPVAATAPPLAPQAIPSAPAAAAPITAAQSVAQPLAPTPCAAMKERQVLPAEQGLAQLVMQPQNELGESLLRKPPLQQPAMQQHSTFAGANDQTSDPNQLPNPTTPGFQLQQHPHLQQPTSQQQQHPCALGMRHGGTSPAVGPASGASAPQSLAPGPMHLGPASGTATPVLPQHPQQHSLPPAFDVPCLGQLRRPSPDNLTRLQTAPHQPQAMHCQGLGQNLGAPGPALNGLLGLGPLIEGSSSSNASISSSTASLQSQGSGLLATHGTMPATINAGAQAGSATTGSQATAGFGWQLPLSPQQSMQPTPQSGAQQLQQRELQQLHPSAPSPAPQGQQQHSQKSQQQQLAAFALQHHQQHQQQQHQAAAAAAAVAAAAAMSQQAAQAQAAATIQQNARPLFSAAPHLQGTARPQQQNQQQQLPNLSAQNAAHILAAHAHAHAQAQAHLQVQAQMQGQAQSTSHQQFQQQQQQQQTLAVLAAAAAAAEDAVNAQAGAGSMGGFSLFSHFPSTIAAREAELRQQIELQQQQQQRTHQQLKTNQQAAEERQQQQQQQQVLQATLQQQVLQAQLQQQQQQQQAAVAAALQAPGSGLTAHQAQQLTTYLLQQQAQQQQQQQQQHQQRQVAQAAQHAQQRLALQHAVQQAQQQVTQQHHHQQQALAAQQQAQAQAAQLVAQAQAAAQVAQAQAAKQQAAQHDALSAPWSVLSRSLQQHQSHPHQLSGSANSSAASSGMGTAAPGAGSQLLFNGLTGAGGFLNGAGAAAGLAGMATGLGSVQGLANGPGSAAAAAARGMAASEHPGVSVLGANAGGVASWMRGAQADGVLGGGVGAGAAAAAAGPGAQQQHHHHHHNQHIRQSISLSNLVLSGSAGTGPAAVRGGGGASGLSSSIASLEGGFFGQGQHPPPGMKGSSGSAGMGGSAGHGMFGSQGSLLTASALGGGAATAAAAGGAIGSRTGAINAGQTSLTNGVLGNGVGLGGAGQGLGGAGLGGLGLGGLGGGLGMLGAASGMREGGHAGNATTSAHGNGAAGVGTYSLFGGSQSPSIAQSLVGMTSLLG